MVSLSSIVPLNENVAYKSQESISTVKIRWVQAQCYEIKLPNGKTIVTDPFFGGGVIQPPFPISAGDLEGCDYILLNHSHIDHILHVPDLYKRFRPLIICDTRFAFELSKAFDIPFGSIFPIQEGGEYVFDDFRLNVFPALHNPVAGDTARRRMANAGKALKEFGVDVPAELTSVGSLCNLNFMLTLPNKFRIGFAAGVDMLNMKEAWRTSGPNLLLRQRMVYATAEEYAKDIVDLCGTITVPMHHETAFPINSDMSKFMDEVNQRLDDMGYVGRAMNPSRMKWYSVFSGIAAE